MLTLVLAMILLVSSIDLDQGYSLRDLARANGGVIEASTSGEFRTLGIPDLVRESQAIVYGRVSAMQPTLSDDESVVFTLLQIRPIRILKMGAGPASQAAPGPQSILVRMPGGRLEEGGLRMITRSDGFPESEALKPNEEAILFLNFFAPFNAYYLSGGASGVFRVREGMVVPMTLSIAKEQKHEPVPLGRFLSTLDGLLRTQ
jgi:hypothetical protein